MQYDNWSRGQLSRQPLGRANISTKMEHNNQSGKSILTSWRSPYDIICTFIAIIFGLIIGWLDLHTTEVTVTIVSLFIAGSFLGILQPTAAWRWAILIVFCLPAMVLYAQLIDMQTAEPTQLDVRIIIVTLIITLFGSYIGVFIRKALRGLTRRSS